VHTLRRYFNKKTEFVQLRKAFWQLAEGVPGSDGIPVQPCDILKPGTEWKQGVE
jgi:hypothetical protein